MNINWDCKVLSSIVPVIENLECLSIDDKMLETESKKLINYNFTFQSNSKLITNVDNFIRKSMLINSLNFAFTDFDSSTKYALNDEGVIFSDSEAMVYQIDSAISRGVPILDGYFMRDITEKKFHELFSANIPMPLAAEKVNVLHEIGDVLVKNYSGDWINFINDGPRKLYADGEGLIDRLIGSFTRFDDFSILDKNKIYFLKLAQLAFWGIHRELSNSKQFHIEDLENMTAFADYIVPVALEHLKITNYKPDLKKKIINGELIERDSREEIEIRAATIYVTAKMTEIINKHRPENQDIYIPHLDFKFWSEYHSDEKPHHLTKTIMY
tara:strand:+ start:3131 stop:4111 length:981 start_codon:yes stop_codon:yes gene_type:complete